MKLFKLSRLAVLGIAALAIVGLVSADGVIIRPRKEWALITDAGTGAVNTGSVHRLDAYSGVDHGSFGQGNLNNPVAIAVQPATGVAYVAERTAIKRFDPVSGGYLGSIVSGVSGGLYFDAIRFDSAGHLYAVVLQNGGQSYRLFQVNPATGATLNVSALMPANSITRLSLGFRPNGTVEVSRVYVEPTDSSTNDATFIDHFTGASVYQSTDVFSAYLSATFQLFRTSDDTYIRWQGLSAAVGWKELLTGGVGNVANWATVETFDVKEGFHILFAESYGHETYALQKMGKSFGLRGYNTKGIPTEHSFLNLGSFPAGELTGMAIFVK